MYHMNKQIGYISALDFPTTEEEKNGVWEFKRVREIIDFYSRMGTNVQKSDVKQCSLCKFSCVVG